MECWNAKILSRIVLKAGTPLITDKLTKSMERISYAMVLLDVDISKPLVRTVLIIDACDVTFAQEVCFEQEPVFCTSCHYLGHAIDQCHNTAAAPRPATHNSTAEPCTAPVSDKPATCTVLGTVLVSDLPDPSATPALISPTAWPNSPPWLDTSLDSLDYELFLLILWPPSSTCPTRLCQSA